MRNRGSDDYTMYVPINPSQIKALVLLKADRIKPEMSQVPLQHQ